MSAWSGMRVFSYNVLLHHCGGTLTKESILFGVWKALKGCATHIDTKTLLHILHGGSMAQLVFVHGVATRDTPEYKN